MDEHSDSPRPLADMLGDAPPEHDLRGRLMVLVIYACGAVTWAGIVSESNDWSTRLAVALVALPIFATAVLVARALNRFECWSWFLVGGWFVLIFLTAVTALFLDELRVSEKATAAAITMTLLGALHYLWLRRWDFWTDTRFERLRPRRRVVTPEWRAARLARIGARTGRVRRTVSPRPGALWMRRASAVRG